ncbi:MULTISPECIES: GNAT family N-acetyltransferase [Streptomyces]|uniref:GNAT family N-acetyltransferase n=1 Tax=Streptomyces TaxID=1883 RepID=UPI00163CF7BC|nr:MULTISPECIES: GNAT family N-acetyltransferase [Streptomyces]MBC2878417.1 GNAT family N-acetyltransferase [Streptomyces sp. TYQ1024]
MLGTTRRTAIDDSGGWGGAAGGGGAGWALRTPRSTTARPSSHRGQRGARGVRPAWTWGGLCGIELLWVRGDSRADGWGSRILRAAEAEARRRGCDRVAVSSFTFQAPGFYRHHGYVETGRTLGIPGGHADVHLFKPLTTAGQADPS